MTEVQAGLLKLLKEIDEICREHHLTYYLAGGCFIGAVRHGGFLPWDDDADIHMPREDYLKFHEIVNASSTNRCVVSKDDDENYPMLQPRYIGLDSTCMTFNSFMTRTPLGQFVDIFVLSTVPDSSRAQRRYEDDFFRWRELIQNTFQNDSRLGKQIISDYNRFVRFDKSAGKKKTRYRFEKKLFQISPSKGSFYRVFSAVAPCPVYLKSDWGKALYVPFENTMLPIGEKAESILKDSYGERWYEIPEVVERDMHNLVTDSKLPYTIYETSDCNFINSEQFLARQKEKKNYWFSILPDRNFVNPLTHYMKGLPLLYEIELFIETHAVSLDDWIGKRRFAELDRLFAPLFAYMSQQAPKYWGILFDLPEQLLYAALLPKVMRGDYGMARKLLARHAERRKLSDRLRRLTEEINATASLLELLYTRRDYRAARELTDAWLEDMPDNPYFARADIKLRLSEEGEKDTNALLRRTEGYLRRFPNDPELVKYQGDLYLLAGDGRAAARCYRLHWWDLKNGIELRALKENLAKLEAEI